MKNITFKNKLDTSLLFKALIFLLLMVGSQRLAAQDPLEIEGGIVNIKKLNVTENLQVRNPITVNGLTVNGQTTLRNGKLTVDASSTSEFNGPFTTNSTANFQGSLTSNNTSNFNGPLTANKTATFKQGFTATGFSTLGLTQFTGKVGIGILPGTTSPTLHVNGGIRVEASVSIGGGNSFSVDAPGKTGGRFTILENGNVGIGNKAPQAPLHISNRIIYSINNARALGPYNDVVSRNYGAKTTVCILADGDIVSKTAVFAQSDIRIKKSILATSTSTDLQSLKDIEVVNYKKIDTINDNRLYKKVIAQQVQKVYPLAVQQTTQDFIPSVFQGSLSIDKQGADKYLLAVANPHNLSEDDTVELKCYPGNQSEEVKVSKIISPTQFEVQSTTELDTLESVFVFGKQVNDLLSVDYDAISMLNVSATQEIAKQLEALQTENQSLVNRIEVLEKQVEGMEGLKASVALLLKQKENEIGNVSSVAKLKK